MGLGCLSEPKSKLGLPRITTGLDKSLNQSPQGGLENIGYTSSNGPPKNWCKVPDKYLIGYVLGRQNGGPTLASSCKLDLVCHFFLTLKCFSQNMDVPVFGCFSESFVYCLSLLLYTFGCYCMHFGYMIFSLNHK